MFNIPNFRRKRDELRPVKFVPVEKVFSPQVEVTFLKDVNGWVGNNPSSRRKWSFSTGKTYAIDTKKAREFTAKGYVEPVHPLDPPLSHDEILSFRVDMTTIGLGVNN